MGDLNGHVGTNRASFENCLGYFSIVDINEEGQRIFSVRNGLKVMSTYFQHKDNYKFTWYGWNSTMQSEYNKPPEPRNGASTTNHSNHTTERVQQTTRTTQRSEYNKPPEPHNGASTTNHMNHTTERVQQTT